MEDLQKQFITSFQSILTQEGKEICKEVLVMIGEQDELMMKKTIAFCDFFLSYKLDGVNDKKLKERCKKYLKEFNNFQTYKSKYDRVKYEREERERLLNI